MESVHFVIGYQFTNHVQNVVLHFGQGGVEEKAIRLAVVSVVATARRQSPCVACRETSDSID